MKTLDADQLMAALRDGCEIALIDVREQSAYGQGHPLLAINIPLSRLELAIRRYVPRLSTRLVILDDNDGMATRAVPVLVSVGYTDMSVLAGGVVSWRYAGFELFRGNYTLTNAFGLHVSEQYGTPEITASRLKARMDAGEDLVILDSRPMSEYSVDALPNSVDVPGSEQIYHFKDLVADPETTIAVTCAGKTRGTLGCQALINVGVPNPLFTVQHGTMGWALAGLVPERGATRQVTGVSAGALEWSAQAGKKLAEEFDIRRISMEQLTQWRQDKGRTLYVIDVRSAEEYEAGHLDDAMWVPGGELTGCAEDHLATRNARLCLVDDNGARASACAMWMIQMGWPDVAVLDGGIDGHPLVKGHEPDMSLPPPLEVAIATVHDIAPETTTIVDVSSSSTYMRGHIPGALWAVRSALPDIFDSIRTTGQCIVLSGNDQLSAWAAADLGALGCDSVSYLAGGMSAWESAGKPVADGMENPLIDIRDVYAKFAGWPGDSPDVVNASYLNTIAWRKQLLAQFHRDGAVQFL